MWRDGIFPRAFALSGSPFAKKVTPGTTIPPAKQAMYSSEQALFFCEGKRAANVEQGTRPTVGKGGGGVRVGVEKIRRSFKFLSDAGQPEGDEIAALFA